jgi:hypothetical protein
MTTTCSDLHNRTLASIMDEFHGDYETKSVVYCDAGNGCGFGESGRITDYDPATMAGLIMTDIPAGEDRTSEDGFDSMTQSAWQDGENGYRWRVRF